MTHSDPTLRSSYLLYMTGGVENPFAVLILVPVTVSATILTLRSTVVLGLLAFVLAGALTADHYPLPWVADVGIALPDTYQWGTRSEEHTSELPSLLRISYAVFCLKQQHY